ncbi:MAG: ParB N-terminal domain-containing protein [Marinosulfonomonas sp.]|nr:ParB N-terminal domain-containing protein [Marinosulfonomonas sp.]
MPSDQNQELVQKTQSSAEIADSGCSTNETSGAGPGHNSGYGSIANCQIIQKPLADIKAAKNPVRKLKKKQIARVERSARLHQFLAPIVIDENYEIVDGHTRLEVARQLGLATVSCICIDHLSAIEKRSLKIALNKTQETGTWDEGALKLEFEYLLEFGTDLTVTGFEPTEIDAVLDIGGTVEEADPLDEFGELPSADAKAVTRLGDTWKLEDHCILCGNARHSEDLDRMVRDMHVAMVFTDPPFNLQISGHVRTTDTYEEFAEASGEMSRPEFIDFLAETLGVAASSLAPGGLLYAFMDWRHIGEMTTALERLGLQLINLCVWAKPNGGMGSLYRSRHELVFVAKVPGAPHRNNIELGKHGRYRTNVWEYTGATGGAKSEDDDFTVHPTVKPVGLVADAILDVTALGETVLDPFLGSGTTLLAAERTRRKCLGVEISPAYVDVAIRRWQEMTGLDAVHVETGETFNERAGRLAASEGLGITRSDGAAPAPTPEMEDF